MLPVTADVETPLAEKMEVLNDAYKGFRREKDPVKGAVAAREAQQALVKTLDEIPEMVAKMPDGPAKKKAASEYRKMMGKLYVSLCEVELAFLGNDLDEVAKLVADLKKLKKAGHGEFMEDE